MSEDLWPIVDDSEPIEPDAAEVMEPPTRLDLRRIERIATLHKAGLRRRSWSTLLAIFCWIAAVEFAIIARTHWDLHEHRLARVPCVLTVVCFAEGARRFLRTPRSVRPVPSDANDPVPPPDFAPLGDGSQGWRDCEQIR